MSKCLFVLAAFAVTAFAQKPAWTPPPRVTLPLWPNGAPGAQPDTSAPAEVDKTTAKDNLVAGKPLVRLGDVSNPTLTLYKPQGTSTGAAVVVFPGGGYTILAIDLEGLEVCDRLNSTGVSCILVKYRVPNSGPYPKSSAALQDAQRAIGIVRAHATEWDIDPHRIGVLGFSAGGHLAAAVSTNFDQRVYPPIDSADQLSCRPDFTVLIYPAYLSSHDDPLALNSEIHVTAQTPPAFLVQAEDDTGAPIENSMAYYAALKRAKIPAELHIYATGGHGYGLRPTELPVTRWPELVDVWLRTMKITK